jgi:hypothetical protein
MNTISSFSKQTPPSSGNAWDNPKFVDQRVGQTYNRVRSYLETSQPNMSAEHIHNQALETARGLQNGFAQLVRHGEQFFVEATGSTASRVLLRIAAPIAGFSLGNWLYDQFVDSENIVSEEEEQRILREFNQQ